MSLWGCGAPGLWYVAGFLLLAGAKPNRRYASPQTPGHGHSRVRLLVAGALAARAAVPLFSASPARGSAPYRVGAAKIDVPPPPYDASQDARDFPSCDTALFNGPRKFAFEEPYRDLD